MRFAVLVSLITLLFIGTTPVFAQSGTIDEIRQKNRLQIQETRKERKAHFEALSHKKQQSIRKNRADKFQSSSNEQKTSIKDHRSKRQELATMAPEERKAYMAERRAAMVDRWSKLPPEVRARRKEKFNKMPEARKQAFKTRHPRIYADLISADK